MPGDAATQRGVPVPEEAFTITNGSTYTGGRQDRHLFAHRQYGDDDHRAAPGQPLHPQERALPPQARQRRQADRPALHPAGLSLRAWNTHFRRSVDHPREPRRIPIGQPHAAVALRAADRFRRRGAVNPVMRLADDRSTRPRPGRSALRQALVLLAVGHIPEQVRIVGEIGVAAHADNLPTCRAAADRGRDPVVTVNIATSLSPLS